MSARLAAPSRHMACPRCGAAFDCALSADCWCSAEPYRLPLSGAACEDCLCPTCLRQTAAKANLPRRATLR